MNVGFYNYIIGFIAARCFYYVLSIGFSLDFFRDSGSDSSGLTQTAWSEQLLLRILLRNALQQTHIVLRCQASRAFRKQDL